MTSGQMGIGIVAELSGTPVTTLRYYERIGLIDPPARVGGKRRYDPAVLVRIMMIRFCRVAGLSLDQIAEVVADVSPGQHVMRAIAEERLQVIDAHLAELGLARDMMAAVLACRCARVEACECGSMGPVIERLRDVDRP